VIRRTIFLVAIALATPAAAQAPATWTMPTEYPASSMPGEGVRFFTEAVKRATNGRLEITPSFDAAAGLKSADMIKAVAARRVAAADAFAGALGDTNPLFLLPSLPFVTATIGEAKLLYEVARPAYEKVLAAHDQILLYATPWPPSGIWAKRALVAPTDIAGLTIRTYDATGTAVFKAAGAAPVELSFADTMPRLRDGSVTAVLSSGDGGAGRRLWELLPHFTEINYALPLSLAIIHRDALAELPADQQQAVRQAAAETERHQWQLIETRLAENYARMRENGVTITTSVQPDLTAQFQRAAATALDAWAEKAGADAKALLAEFRRRAGKS
jgi:TRAP-type C4-dicarboxylate transport system substrate-binding protein